MASRLIEQARSQGYRRSEILDLDLRTLGEHLASVTGVFVRLNGSEEEISRFGFAYIMRKDAGKWRIVVALAHEVPWNET